MHNSIKRTTEEIEAHISFIHNEINTRIGTYADLSQQIVCLNAIVDACLGALHNNLNVDDAKTMEIHTEADKYYRDTCYWLAGKLFRAPNCDPAHDAEVAKKLHIPNLKIVK